MANKDILKRYDILDQNSANLRSEVVRLTNERNAEENLVKKYRIKSQERGQEIHRLKEDLKHRDEEKSKIIASDQLRAMNDEIREKYNDLQRKYKNLKYNHVKKLSLMIQERDKKIAMLKQLCHNNHTEMRLKDSDLRELATKLEQKPSRQINIQKTKIFQTLPDIQSP